MKKVRLYEEFLNEANKEYDIAYDIIQDLLNEYDPWEIQDMLPQDAVDTVDAYGYKGSKAKKIATHLLNIAQEGTFESVDVNEAKLNTLRDVIKAVKKEYGPTPSEQSLADFVVRNYKDITGEDLEDSIPAMNDKLADIVAHYRMDGEDFMIAFDDAREGR